MRFFSAKNLDLSLHTDTKQKAARLR